MKVQGVSIIICCHNGARRLPETIRHITRQRVPATIPWELLVVDNGSTDGTAGVARMTWQSHPVNSYLRIVREPTLGLSYARARGFREARYEYMIMCDDDNWLQEDYVYRVYDILSTRPAIGAVGGLGKLVFEIEPPFETLTYIFAGGPQASQTGKATENKLYGAGCAIRHSAYARILEGGFKSLLTDRKGVELSSGGDYELCLALAIVGYDIWYDDRLRFTHFITRERLTWQYCLRYALESSRCFHVITSYKTVASRAPIRRFPWLAITKDFVVCSLNFLAANSQRLFSSNGSLSHAMYFRHVVFKNLLIAYLIKFRGMVETHKTILKFSERYLASKQVYRPDERRAYILRSGFLSLQNLRDRFDNVFGT